MCIKLFCVVLFDITVYKLIAVVVSPAGGGLLLILIIVLIVTCCKYDSFYHYKQFFLSLNVVQLDVIWQRLHFY